MAIEDRQEKMRLMAGRLESKICELEGTLTSVGQRDPRAPDVTEEIGALRKRLLEIESILYGCG